ncbi:hypothetical protein [Haloarchaeobius baliensis]|uniref:hypothetical protein n=1 Tax=Haloarchaeobius baliensis TaxID=1670458 RepID=UPI003F881E96
MTEPIRVRAGELEADEILAALREGRRVRIITELLGSEHEVTLRHDGTIFYCDTPTTLHKHETEAGMRRCIENQGYAPKREE